VLCLFAQIALTGAVLPVAAEDLDGNPVAEEQYWAFLDSAAALHARRMDAVALQEIDEALLLRPGDAEAMALRDSIVAALNPAPSAKAETPGSKSEPIALERDAQHDLPLIDLTQAALALVRGDADHLDLDWEAWRALVLAFMESRAGGQNVR
jgi:hypothetical protein